MIIPTAFERFTLIYIYSLERVRNDGRVRRLAGGQPSA